MITIVAAAVVVAIGAVVRGYSGFGASMFWVIGLTLLYPPATVVPTVLALEVVASISLLPAVWRQVEWRSMSWMLGATVATTPIGIALLAWLPAEPMRVVVAVSILVATLAMAVGVSFGRRERVGTALGAGGISGVVNGSTGIGGPPAVLLYFSDRGDEAVGRATLIAYFLGTDAAGFAMMAGVGLVDREVLLHTAVCAPVALLGIALGHRLFERTSGRGFRPVVLATLAVLGVAVLVRAFVG
ncbi:sulfite exporter TauE/SafE family protein [Aeromicrobium sp. CF4.19]|uniref:sulfite exporter TauE/SafE family protein n=1 Tax=Aeromicrobium sp. CF4.19 TaxID=3373082 RepID=UPI003EE62ACC